MEPLIEGHAIESMDKIVVKLNSYQQHKKDCEKRIAELQEEELERERRAAELHNEKLFKQPPPKEDCPICMIPLPSLITGSKYRACCGKRICSGCLYAVAKRDGGVGLCPFCRTPSPTSDEEILEEINKCVEVGDANALFWFMGYPKIMSRH